jgi:transporter family protein
MHRGNRSDRGFGFMQPALLMSWQVWAVLAAIFAALTAIFAKLGVENVSADLATFLRVVVVLAALIVLLTATRQWRSPESIPWRTYLFLILSGLATGASWLCYFRALKIGEAARVAPIDKLSVVIVAVIGTLFLGERLSGVGWLGIVLIAAGAALVAR